MSDWYLSDPAGAPVGPFATQAIVQWINSGQVTGAHSVNAVGTYHWVSVNEVLVFATALAARSEVGPSGHHAVPVPPNRGHATAVGPLKEQDTKYVGAQAAGRIMARLLIGAPQGSQTVTLAPVNSLGRHPNNSIHFRVPDVSKEHCVVEWRNQGWFLRDLSSTNGSLINGKLAHGEVLLTHRDEIALGSIKMRFDELGTLPISDCPTYESPSPVAPAAHTPGQTPAVWSQAEQDTKCIGVRWNPTIVLSPRVQQDNSGHPATLYADGPNQQQRINRRVLRFVRDQGQADVKQIAAHLLGSTDSVHWAARSVVTAVTHEYEVTTALGVLVGAGLIMRVSPDTYSPTAALRELQQAIGLSLSALCDEATPAHPDGAARDPTILLITAVGTERLALIEMLQREHNITCPLEEINGRYYDYFSWPGRASRPWNVFLGQPTEKGPHAAQALIQDFVKVHPPALVLMVGMCGGLHEHGAEEGAVLMARHVFNYEPGRLRAGSSAWSPTAFRCTPRLLDLANALSSRGEFKGIKVLATKDYGSGEKLIDDLSSGLRQRILGFSGDIAGFEMEGHGLLHAVWELQRADHFDVAIVKGVADFGDGRQQENKQARQQIATTNAARVALKLISAF